MKITIFGNSRCSWCTKAVELAEQYRMDVTYKDTDNARHLAEMKDLIPSVKTIPQIWVNDLYVGGYTDLATCIEETMGNYGQGGF